MIYNKQIIRGKIPSNVEAILENSELGSEEWVRIPFTSNIYFMSRTGRIIRFCKYEGKKLNPHFFELSTNEGRVSLGGRRTCVKELHYRLFGISHYNDADNYRWMDIQGFEWLYQISEKGEVRSYPKTIYRKNGVAVFIHERIIKPTIINSGYKTVNLHKDGKLYHFLVHRLVAEHFLQNSCNLEQVNHKDENKLNNEVENLEWCSRSYNSTYGTCDERRKRTRMSNNNGKYGYKHKINRI